MRPSYPLVKKIKKRRMVWLGKVLQRPAGSLVRDAMLQLAHRCLIGDQCAAGTLIDGTPQHGSVEELVQLAMDTKGWTLMCNLICTDKKPVTSKAKRYLEKVTRERAPTVHSMTLRVRKPVQYY